MRSSRKTLPNYMINHHDIVVPAILELVFVISTDRFSKSFTLSCTWRRWSLCCVEIFSLCMCVPNHEEKYLWFSWMNTKLKNNTCYITDIEEAYKSATKRHQFLRTWFVEVREGYETTLHVYPKVRLNHPNLNLMPYQFHFRNHANSFF